MVQSLITRVMKLINSLLSINGILSTMSPATIVEGKGNPDFNHKRIPLGSYAIFYTGTKTVMKRRNVPEIALNE